MKNINIILVIFIFLTCSDLWAFRCSHQVIQEGDSLHRIFALCGKPDLRHDSDLEYIKKFKELYETKEQIQVTKLLYDSGPKRLVRILTFHDEYLKSIKLMDYGDQKNSNTQNCLSSSVKQFLNTPMIYIFYQCGEPDVKKTTKTLTQKIKQSNDFMYFSVINEIEWKYWHPKKKHYYVLNFENDNFTRYSTEEIKD